MQFTPEQIQTIRSNLHKLPANKQQEVLDALQELEKRKTRSQAQVKFLDFVKIVWPGFISGRHHQIMAEKFEAVARGEIKRLAISLPPRHTKSEFASYLLPAWFLGNYPEKQIMQASHTADLAVNFGRKVRNLVDSNTYRGVFPDTELQTDSKSAGRWGTNKGGVYNALGVGGGAAGKGADIFIIDDPHNEQDIINGNTDVFDKAWEWYMSGPRQRLQPGGSVIVVHTRWGKKDLIGRLLDYSAKNPNADQWEYIEFPAIFDADTPSERSLWPEFWPLPELQKIRNTIAPHLWAAQYMQNPTTEEGALIKKEWWQDWDREAPPDCDYTIMSLDAAQEAHNRADYNAVTLWGVFYRDNDYGQKVANIILLNAWKERMEFPQLKRAMLEEYEEWEPDTFLVEKKSNGSALYQEFRQAGIPVSEYTPSKGNDKISRVNAVSDIFASGMVWAPKGRRWAQEVIEECSDFPNGEHDDYVDSCFVGDTLILMADGSEKRIDAVVVGDWVMTPSGKQIVSAVFDNGYKEVWEVTAGRKTYATANHLMMTAKGWTRVDKLSVMVDTITQANTGEIAWHSRRKQELMLCRLFLTVKNTTDTLIALIRRTVGILRDPGLDCIGMSGSFITGLFRKGIMYTISMGIQPTIGSRIWNASQAVSTTPSIELIGSPEASQINSDSTLSGSEIRHLRGINRRTAENGINSTQLHRSPPLKRPDLRTEPDQGIARVYGADQLSQDTHPENASVLQNARQRNQNSGMVKVVRNTHTMRRVYDLTVENEHCYYANGMLVHNCTQALIRFRNGGFIRLQTDYEDDPREFRSHRQQRYYAI